MLVPTGGPCRREVHCHVVVGQPRCTGRGRGHIHGHLGHGEACMVVVLAILVWGDRRQLSPLLLLMLALVGIHL